METQLFNPRQFDDLHFPVLKHPREIDLLTTFPELHDIPSFPGSDAWIAAKQSEALQKNTVADIDAELARGFGEDLDTRRVFDFVCFCYDAHSPILKKYMDDEKNRKTNAVSYAGWKDDKASGYFPAAVDSMMHGMNERVNMFVIDFLRLFNDPNYALLIVSLESYFSSLKTLMGNTKSIVNDSKSKNIVDIEINKVKLIQQISQQKEMISKMSAEYLRDTNFNLRKSLFNVMNQELKNRLLISPERRANVVDA